MTSVDWDSLLNNTNILVCILQFSSWSTPYILTHVCAKWNKAINKPSVWDSLDNIPSSSILTCFRRAAHYFLREIDAPIPNVNRNDTTPIIRSCLIQDRTTVYQYLKNLKKLHREHHLLRKTPIEMENAGSFSNSTVMKPASSSMVSSSIMVIDTDSFDMADDSFIISGGLHDTTARFVIWCRETRSKISTITLNYATCFDLKPKCLAIGCSDGSIKVWNFSSPAFRSILTKPTANFSPTLTLNKRVLALSTAFFSRSSQKISKIFIYAFETIINVAAVVGNGDVSVWNAKQGDLKTTISSSSIHQSRLLRSQRHPNPTITSLLLFRNKLVCGTSAGFIRVFDIRSGKICHRLAGHPGEIRDTQTLGGVMWSGGADGSVRWWGGKSAKVLPKSNLCDGPVSVLSMSTSVVLVGYEKQGMEVYDVVSQNPLRTFSSSFHGGVLSVKFDETKLVTVSTDGKAALWYWNSPHPVYWFSPPSDGSLFASVYFDSKVLVFGTTGTKIIVYELISMKKVEKQLN